MRLQNVIVKPIVMNEFWFVVVPEIMVAMDWFVPVIWRFWAINAQFIIQNAPTKNSIEI